MSTVLHAVTLGLYLAVGGVYTTTLVTGKPAVPRPGVLLIAGAVLMHAVALATFTATYGELPLVGIAASLSTFAFLIGTCLLAAALITESRPLGLVLAPIIVVLLIAVLALGVAPGGTELEFRGVWFVAHVVLAFIGYTGMAVAFASSLLYLLQFRELKDKRFGRVFRFFPSLEMLDTVSHRALLTGFSSLSLALVLAWAWTVRFKHSLEMSDPKILWAMFSWAAFAVALAARSGGAGAERRAARVTILAFTAIIVAYLIIRIAVARGGVFL